MIHQAVMAQSNEKTMDQEDTATTEQAVILFYPENKDKLKDWLKEAKKNDEIDSGAQERFWEIYDDLESGSDDANHIYNYGRAISKLVQPAYAGGNTSFSNAATQLMVQAEVAYRYAIRHCECHGRANIMLGMLYNQEGRFDQSEPYLEKGLQLKEGDEDWMIAANQYLLSGAYTYKTKDPKYQEIYKKYQQYAETHPNAYYRKMSAMYVPYYED